MAPAPVVACDEPVPVVENVTLGPDSTNTAPAPVIEFMPDDTYVVPARFDSAPVTSTSRQQVLKSTVIW